MALEMMFYELGKRYKRLAVGCSRLPNTPSYGSGKVGTSIIRSGLNVTWRDQCNMG